LVPISPTNSQAQTQALTKPEPGIATWVLRLAAFAVMTAALGEMTATGLAGLAFESPRLTEISRAIGAGLHVGAGLALALAAWALWSRQPSAWWAAAGLLLGARFGMSLVELLVVDYPGPSPSKLALVGLSVVAGWGSLGLACWARGADGSPWAGRAAGLATLLCAGLLAGFYMSYSGPGTLRSLEIALLELARAAALVAFPLLGVFLLSAGRPVRDPSPEPVGPLAAAGALGFGLLAWVAGLNFLLNLGGLSFDEPAWGHALALAVVWVAAMMGLLRLLGLRLALK
jgi:hypothetical protein